MKDNIYKTITYITLSLLLGFISYKSNSIFMAEFITGLIPLLTTIFAINMPAAALIIGDLYKVKDKHPDADIALISKEIGSSIFIQILFIGILFFFFTIKDFIVNHICSENIKQYIEIGMYSLSIGVFVYFLEIIYDLGKALFDIIHFNIDDV